jgi:HEAT repeat protein
VLIPVLIAAAIPAAAQSVTPTRTPPPPVRAEPQTGIRELRVVRVAVPPEKSEPAPEHAIIERAVLFLDARLVHRRPPAPWTEQDSAYVDYRRAYALLEDGSYRQAAEIFERIARRYPASQYASNAWYWSAFARYRLGDGVNLRTAVMHLEAQRRVYPNATSSRSDALILGIRLRGELARRGDGASYRALIEALHTQRSCSRTGANVKIEALSALQQIDPATTMRYIRQVFEGTEDCASGYRRDAVFVLAQIQSQEAIEVLYSLAGDGRELDVRIEAVHWLSDTPDPRAIALFAQLLRSPSPLRLKDAAMFALTRQATQSDAAIFRDIAGSRYMASRLRTQAVMWLAEQRLSDQSAFILELYENDASTTVRQAVVKAIAAQRDESSRPWMLSVGRDSSASIELRKLAITSAVELSVTSAELFQLYRDVQSAPLREHIIDALGGLQEKLAIERLIDIATIEEERELRRSSLNWLRQSKDPRAVAFVTSYREKSN